jgi:hypothetical protein
LRYLERSIAQWAPAYGLRCGGFRQHFTPQAGRSVFNASRCPSADAALVVFSSLRCRWQAPLHVMLRTPH